MSLSDDDSRATALVVLHDEQPTDHEDHEEPPCRPLRLADRAPPGEQDVRGESLAPATAPVSLDVQRRGARPRRPSGAGESSVTFSGYHSLALVDVESLDGRAFVPARGERRAPRRDLDPPRRGAGAGGGGPPPRS